MAEETEKPESPDEAWIKPLISARKSQQCPYCKGEARLLVDMDSGFPLYNVFGHWQYQCLACDRQVSVDLHGYVVERS